MKENNTEQMDNAEIIDGALLLRLNMLFKLYREAEIDEKRLITGSIFPEKWKILEKAVRTAQINSAEFFIYMINNRLERKKAGIKTSKSFHPGSVPISGNTFNI